MSHPRSRLLSPILALCGYGALAASLVRELAAPRDALRTMHAVTLGLLLVWLVLEAPLAFRMSGDDQRGEDRGTVALNGAARVLAIVAALSFPPVWTSWNAVETAGLVLFVAGFGLRLAAIRQLGRFYSHKVRRAEGHQVVDAGPYRLVRHPAYLGVIAAHLGFAVVFLNLASMLSVLFLVVPAFVWRIKVEEPVLMKIPGYSDYAASRSRLVPKLW